VVGAGDRRWQIDVVGELPGPDQMWLAIGDRRYLVDGWVATALAPDPLALRVRAPLARAASSDHVTFTPSEAVVMRHPRQLGKPRVPLDPALGQAIDDALAGIELVGLGHPGHGDGEPFAVSSAATASAPSEHVACDAGQVAIDTDTGSGCVARERWDRLRELVARLAGPLEAIADHRPLPLPPKQLVLAGNAQLDLRKAPTLGDGPADRERVAELVAALTAPAELVAMPPGPATSTIGVTDRSDLEFPLELHAKEHVLVVLGRALRPSPEAWQVITRSVDELRDATRWLEDATTIHAIRVDRSTYTRGAVIGEWTGATDPALVEALAAALAAVRAPAGPQPSAVEHEVEITVAPPGSHPSSHRLAIGHPGPDGCAAVADGAAVRLPLAVCTAVLAVAR
jgi:hypothetical protein